MIENGILYKFISRILDFYKSKFTKKLVKFERDLPHIKVFLEARGFDSSGTDNWISNITKVAFDLEDFIEMHNYLSNSRLKCLVWLINQHFFDILALRTRNTLDQIRGLHDGIEIDREGVTSNNDHIPIRESTCRKKFIVGLKEDITGLIKRLLEEINGVTGLYSISIVGMGGIGKTTLAGLIYNNPKIANEFTRLWISVTRQLNYKDLLIAILHTNSLKAENLDSSLGEFQVEELQGKVNELLQNKRYLAVVDDVWTQEEMDIIKSAFHDNCNGSRLIITTRNHELQMGFPAIPGIRHQMNTLNEQDSRKLLCQMASIEADNTEFEDIQENILKICSGLPLAITVVGRNLKAERNRYKWETVYHELSTLQGASVQDIIKVLALTCDKLSVDLRSCFLRIGFFPENKEIPVKDLIYLWAAEGLIFTNDHDNRGTENHGMINLSELIKCGLIEVAELNSDRTTIKRFKIHPLMHALAASNARKEILFQSQTCDEIRHGSIFDSTGSSTHYLKAPHLRSLLTFEVGGEVSSNYKLLKSMCRYSKLLKVLYLKGRAIKLPDNIGSLWNLRYLNLYDTKIKRLPKSMGNLGRLLTLDVRRNPGLQGISIVKRMKNLRNLHLDDYVEPVRIENLEHLRDFGWVDSQHLIMDELVKMGNLEVLKVIIRDTSKFGEFLQDVCKIEHLVYLKLRLEHVLSSLPTAAAGFLNMPNLKKVHLKLRFPDTERRAGGFRVPMEELQNADLCISTLLRKELVISSGGFPPHLYIEDLQSAEAVVVEV